MRAQPRSALPFWRSLSRTRLGLGVDTTHPCWRDLSPFRSLRSPQRALPTETNGESGTSQANMEPLPTQIRVKAYFGSLTHISDPRFGSSGVIALFPRTNPARFSFRTATNSVCATAVDAASKRCVPSEQDRIALCRSMIGTGARRNPATHGTHQGN